MARLQSPVTLVKHGEPSGFRTSPRWRSQQPLLHLALPGILEVNPDRNPPAGWSNRLCPGRSVGNARFSLLLKTDDDCYVDVDAVLTKVRHKHLQRSNLWWGKYVGTSFSLASRAGMCVWWWLPVVSDPVSGRAGQWTASGSGRS